VELTELVARESIRDIVARYNSLGDSGRVGEMMALFADDARLEVPGRDPLEGVAAIRDFFLSVTEAAPDAAPLRSLRHHTATHRIELETATTARGSCYFAVYTQDGLDHWGCYKDTYRLCAGSWLFSSRTVRLDGVIPGGWAAGRPGFGGSPRRGQSP